MQMSRMSRSKLERFVVVLQAGNLNHAIFESGTSGDYLLILDCDMVRSCVGHVTPTHWRSALYFLLLQWSATIMPAACHMPP